VPPLGRERKQQQHADVNDNQIATGLIQLKTKWRQ